MSLPRCWRASCIWIAADLYHRMSEANEHHRGYLVVKRKITIEEAQSLRELHLDWIDIERRASAIIPTARWRRMCWVRWTSTRRATPASRKR